MNTLKGTLIKANGERQTCVIHNWHEEYMMVQTSDFIGKVHISSVEIECISILNEVIAKYEALENKIAA